MLSLLLGIKRSIFRVNDPRRSKADAEFKAKRPNVLIKYNHTCQACLYESKVGSHMDVHHLNDDHHNNEDSNLVPACHTCHPYQHVGELARRADIPGEAMGRTLIATIPEISARDLNLLQRAIGVALHDAEQAPIALQMIEKLANRAIWVKAEFGTFESGDFAAALAQLTPEEYENRAESISDLRILFNEEASKRLGKEMMIDYPTMPIKSWAEVNKGVAKRAPATSGVNN